MTEVSRVVVATPAALELIELLKAKHGPLMFHQSGDCCDGRWLATPPPAKGC